MWRKAYEGPCLQSAWWEEQHSCQSEEQYAAKKEGSWDIPIHKGSKTYCSGPNKGKGATWGVLKGDIGCICVCLTASVGNSSRSPS